MTLSEIEIQLSHITDSEFDFQRQIDNIDDQKFIFVNENDQHSAKQCWIFQTILRIHLEFNNAYLLIRKKEYYDAWCKLETAEIKLGFLKKHFDYTNNEYKLLFIERAIVNLQAVYPYRLFSSIEIIELEKKCTICNQTISIRKSCGHNVGEIYDGKFCSRLVTKADLVGISVVENPLNKYTVLFSINPETNEKVDHYNYDSVDYLFNLIESPYEEWDLEIQNTRISHTEFKLYGRNDPCPCGSGNKYKKCCLPLSGVKMINYEFIVKQPTAERLLINTTRRLNSN